VADLGNVAVRITADPSTFEAGLSKAAQQGEAFASRLSGSFNALGANVLSTFAAIAAHPIGLIITGLTALIGVLAELSAKAEKAALEQVKLEKQFGLTNIQAAGMQLQARMAGVGMDDLTAGLRAVSRNFGDAAEKGGRAEAALARVGLTSQELVAMPLPAAIALVGDRLATVENRYERAALANAILTRRGAALLPVMMQGAAGMDQAQRSAQTLGLALGETARRIATVRRERTALSAVTDARGMGIGAWISDTVGSISHRINVGFVAATQGEAAAAAAVIQSRATAAREVAEESINRTPENVRAIGQSLENLSRQADHAGLNRYSQAMADLAGMVGVSNDELRRGAQLINAWREAASVAFGENMGRDIEMLGRHIDGYVWGAHDAALQTAVLRGEIQDTDDATLLWQARLEDSMTTVNQLLERSITPAEHLRDTYEQLALAYENGAITADQFRRAAEQAESASGRNDTRLSAGVNFGSSQAISMLNQARVGDEQGPQQRAEQHLAQSEQHLEAIRQALENDRLARAMAQAVADEIGREVLGDMGHPVAVLP
jgi:hypothetical protein